MKPQQLERDLRAAANGEACVERIARYFAAHDLHYGHGTDNAEDEAYWLVRAVQGWDDARWARAPAAPDVPRLAELARARAQRRIPLAYLLGEAWFAGLRFEIDERVLVPRSPLAELVEDCFAPWRPLGPGDRLLDIGTGSGCIAIAAAFHCPGIQVEATDVSKAALEIAAANAARLVPDADLSLLEADLYPTGRDAYRVIVSNPPYVPEARLAELPPEYAHEPVMGLDGGPSGPDVVERILAQAAAHLTPDGVLVVEVGEAQAAFVEAHVDLPVTWLELERGGEGVLLIRREELTGHSQS